MDNISVTPRKVVFRSDILWKCIECTEDITNEKCARRLAYNFKDTLIQVDSDYKSTFSSLENQRGYQLQLWMIMTTLLYSCAALFPPNPTCIQADLLLLKQ